METSLVSNTANPRFEFPLKGRMRALLQDLTYLVKLEEDFETFIEQGLSLQEASELIKIMEQKYLSRENFL